MDEMILRAGSHARKPHSSSLLKPLRCQRGSRCGANEEEQGKYRVRGHVAEEKIGEVYDE